MEDILIRFLSGLSRCLNETCISMKTFFAAKILTDLRLMFLNSKFTADFLLN